MVSKTQEQEYSAIASDELDDVILRGRKIKIGWLRRGTMRKMSQIMLAKDEDLDSESKVSCKLAAAILLNGYWSIKFFWGIKWRWFYYIKQYLDSELYPIVEMGKKKVQVTEYYYIMMSALALKDTHKAMTREEVSRMLREQESAHKAQ